MKRAMGFLLCVLLCAQFVAGQETGSVTWRFALYGNKGNEIGPTAAREPIDLPDGSSFRLALACEQDAFCYIVDEQPDGTVCVMHMGTLRRDQELELPGKGLFFVIEPPNGTEKIHVVVSAKGQARLEKLLKDSLAGNNDPALGRQILDEIAKLRLLLTPYASRPVKPAVMGATSRGSSAGKQPSATVFSGAPVYVETVRIRH